ncbi:MAG: radical SAM protein [archaeon]
MKVEKTKFYSYKLGKLAKGCQQCVKGEKLVLFITGLCSNNCFYCPISDKKKGRDVIYANEWQLKNEKDKKTLIEEAKLCDSKGAGITGGDPLVKLDRTIKYIKLLKKTFGKDFHIHLYTPAKLVTTLKLKKLHTAGLDEIRFHLDPDKKGEWKKILLAKKHEWKIGVEIPAIPDKEKETKQMIDFLDDKIDFLNINELEISDNNANQLLKKGFHTKDRMSYGIKGSDGLAKRLLKYCAKKKVKFNVHYCTCKLKDKVQLAKRIKRRAKNVAKDFDIITSDGMLFRGAIYNRIVPGFDYENKIKKAKDKQKTINKLNKAVKTLRGKHKIPAELFYVDKERLRILTSARISQELSLDIKKLKLKPSFITEYPTHDSLIIELDFL